MRNIKIVVVDDQQLVRLALVHILGAVPDFAIVGEAENGEQALHKVDTLVKQHCEPDVVLMDLRMPGMGGVEATRQLTHRHPGIRVIALTGCGDHPFPQRCLDSGAFGFITKNSGLDEVVRAIHAVMRGKRYLSHQVAQDLALYQVKGQPCASPFEQLSERELQIALMVIDSIKTADIATRLHLSPKSVNTYRYRLFDKLRIHSNMELALLAARHGLLVTDEKG